MDPFETRDMVSIRPAAHRIKHASEVKTPYKKTFCLV